MSDRRTATNGDRAATSSSTSPTQRAFAGYSLALFLGGIGLAVYTHFTVGHSHAVNWWAGSLLVVGFILASRLVIDIDVRKVGWVISFGEVPLVIGALTANFEMVLGAYLIATLVTALSRRAMGKIFYNTGVMLLETITVFLLNHFIQNAVPHNSPVWLGVLGGVLGSQLVSTAAGVVALYLLNDGEPRITGIGGLAGRTVVVTLLNSSIGLVAYELYQKDFGWVLVLLVSGVLVAIYRAYSGLLREHRDLETLSDVSLSVARTGQTLRRRLAMGSVEPAAEQGDWELIAQRISDQLSASRVVLHLRLDPAAESRTLVAGAAYDVPESSSLRDDPLLQLPGSNVRYYRVEDASEDVREALVRRGIREALVVPLRGTHHLLGAIEVHDRQSRWRGFGRSDVRLLRTLASHLATAMDNRRLLAKLQHDAYHDPLTRLLNRPGFRAAVEEPLRTHARSVVLRMDLESVATVSDALGHTRGDELIIIAGTRLRAALGDEVPLARLEGGIFAALLVDCAEEEAHELAERLHADLVTPYMVDRLTVEANAIIGYVPVQSETDSEVSDPDAILQRADVAVRHARNAGTTVRGYAPSMSQIFQRRFQLVTQFRHALESGQVSVHYQPKIKLPERQVLGAEALVRWRHPEYGPVDPDEFVPAVEATGLIDALTSFVMENALHRVRDWLDKGLQLSVAVNLSVRTLADEGFPDRVAEALRRHDVPARLLTFELTESGVMSDPARALPVLRRLHALGVVLAVDDFGTGYSSLAYLRQLPVDEVKIDKSFVLGMGTDLGDMAVVRSIVELGHTLGLTVVAEGVEEDAARDQLVDMGCDVAQGYLISRPLSEDRLEAWLRARTERTRGLRDETILTLVH
ncbi:EAL domain-containing protein [Pseudonocardiaceae bacterium YIM PH 21723]|nr:EAL domain-containing protein [Pseudonocardiaceae bacterium YIM PH 21723]